MVLSSSVCICREPQGLSSEPAPPCERASDVLMLAPCDLSCALSFYLSHPTQDAPPVVQLHRRLFPSLPASFTFHHPPSLQLLPSLTTLHSSTSRLTGYLFFQAWDNRNVLMYMSLSSKSILFVETLEHASEKPSPKSCKDWRSGSWGSAGSLGLGGYCS